MEKNYVEIAEAFTKQGYAFVSVEYSLYPNAKFPCYLVEAAKSIKYIQNQFPNKTMFISGQSAGAWMILNKTSSKIKNDIYLCYSRSN